MAEIDSAAKRRHATDGRSRKGQGGRVGEEGRGGERDVFGVEEDMTDQVETQVGGVGWAKQIIKFRYRGARCPCLQRALFEIGVKARTK